MSEALSFRKKLWLLIIEKFVIAAVLTLAGFWISQAIESRQATKLYIQKTTGFSDHLRSFREQTLEIQHLLMKHKGSLPPDEAPDLNEKVLKALVALDVVELDLILLGSVIPDNRSKSEVAALTQLRNVLEEIRSLALDRIDGLRREHDPNKHLMNLRDANEEFFDYLRSALRE